MARVPSLDHLPDKIKEACGRLIELAEQSEKARRERDKLIVAAVDQAGMPIRVVARYASMSPGHIVRIIGNATDD